MISKQDIIKMARQVFRHSRQQRRPELMNPVREWFIGLAMFLILAGGGSLWVWSEYGFYKALEPENGEIGIELVEYREGAAEAAVARFEERKQVFDALVNAPALAELEAPVEEESSTTTIGIDESAATEGLDEVAPTSTAPGTSTILID